MNSDKLKKRTKKFAIRILKLVNNLPKNDAGRKIGKQLLRSGTSVGANYCAVCRARSNAEFIAKLGIVVEEADESVFWLELIIESNLMKENLVKPLLQEANEITAIMVSSRKTSVDKKNKEKSSFFNPQSSSNGYATLVSVLVIGAVGFSIVTSLVLLGIGSARNSFTIEQSNQAKSLANACIEEALQVIWENDSYVGTDGLTLGQGTCSYTVSSDVVPKTIESAGTVGNVTRKVLATVDQVSPEINISSWQEVAD